MRFAVVLFLFSFASFAQTCLQVEIKGHVRTDKTKMHLVLAEKTMSQRLLRVDLITQPKLSPYINHYVKMKAMVKEDMILSVEDVSDDIRDPLNQNQDSELRKLKDVKCPL